MNLLMHMAVVRQPCVFNKLVKCISMCSFQARSSSSGSGVASDRKKRASEERTSTMKKSKQEGSKPSPPKVTTKMKNEMPKLPVELVLVNHFHFNSHVKEIMFSLKKNAATSA